MYIPSKNMYYAFMYVHKYFSKFLCHNITVKKQKLYDKYNIKDKININTYKQIH